MAPEVEAVRDFLAQLENGVVFLQVEDGEIIRWARARLSPGEWQPMEGGDAQALYGLQSPRT